MKQKNQIAVDKQQGFGELMIPFDSPILLKGSTSVAGTDGGRTGIVVDVANDINSKYSLVDATGHEVLHIMVNYATLRDDHNLQGLLGRPFTYPYINNDILKILKQYVPRKSSDDIIPKQNQNNESNQEELIFNCENY